MSIDWRNYSDPLKGIDPETLSPNRTAKSAEETVELLKAMQESNKRESIKTTIVLIISGLTLLITAIGLFR